MYFIEVVVIGIMILLGGPQKSETIMVQTDAKPHLLHTLFFLPHILSLAPETTSSPI